MKTLNNNRNTALSLVLTRMVTCIALMTMLSGALQAQDAEFLWAKTYHGREVNQENKDRIASVKTDSIGNVYMFGSFGQAARIDGEHICLMEDDTCLHLDLKGLPAGAYFVTLTTPQGSHTEKLVMSE